VNQGKCRSCTTILPAGITHHDTAGFRRKAPSNSIFTQIIMVNNAMLKLINLGTLHALILVHFFL